MTSDFSSGVSMFGLGHHQNDHDIFGEESEQILATVGHPKMERFN